MLIEKFKGLIPEIWTDVSGYPENIVSLHRTLWILRFYGVPIPTKYIKGFAKFFFSIYSMFSMFCVVTFYVTCELIDAYYVTMDANFEDVVQNYGLTLCFFTGIFKVINLLMCRDKVHGMINLLNYMTNEYGNTDHHRKTLHKLEFFVTGVFYLFMFLSWVTCGLAIAMLLTDPTAAGKKLPFRAYIPEYFPEQLIHAIHSFGILWISQLVVTHDSFIMSLMNQIVGQLMILEYNLKGLTSKKVVNWKDEDPKLIYKLKSYIKHHQLILKLRIDLEQTFSAILLMQFLTSMIMFGLCGFLVTYKRNFSPSQLTICMYCSCIFMELYIYCFFANQVILESRAIQTSAYSCLWYEFGDKFCGLLLILMTKSQIFLTLSAGGFFVISLDTFTYVLTRSYSYIAVLRRFYYGK